MESKLQQYIAQETGQIISFDGIAANAGQCVQNVAKWCQFLGLPVEWENAAAWFLNETSAFSQKWTKVVNNPNDPNQLPSPGDLVCFAPSTPGSDGYGHIDIFVKDLGNHQWQGFDSNWNGKAAKLVTHNWAYVMGWYTPKEDPAPAPNPVPLPATGSSAPNDHAIADAGFNVSIPVKGYSDANDAANHINWDGKTMVQPGDYHIFNEYKGMVNVSKTLGAAGDWINPEDEQQPASLVNHDTPATEPGTVDVHEQITITGQPYTNVRQAPSVSAAAHEANTADGNLHPGDVILVTGWVHAENVQGNDIWLRTVRGNWVWAGATNFDVTQTQTKEVLAAAPAVNSTNTAETPAAPEAPVVKPGLVNNVPVKVQNYQDSFKPANGTFKTVKDITIEDFSGVGKSVEVPKGTIVEQGGTFNKDGVKYVRTVNSVTNKVWYGVPADVLVATQNPKTVGANDIVKPATGAVRTLEDDVEDLGDEIFHDINQAEPLLDTALHGKDALVADVSKATNGLVGKIFNKNRKV